MRAALRQRERGCGRKRHRLIRWRSRYRRCRGAKTNSEINGLYSVPHGEANLVEPLDLTRGEFLRYEALRHDERLNLCALLILGRESRGVVAGLVLDAMQGVRLARHVE